jgi:hypothetical protein
MHPRALNERNVNAHARILGAAVTLSDRFSIDQGIVAGLSARDRDAEITQMLQREAVAELLEAIVGPEEDTENEQGEQTGDAEKVKTLDDLTRKQLVALGKARGVPFSRRDNRTMMLGSLRGSGVTDEDAAAFLAASEPVGGK